MCITRPFLLYFVVSCHGFNNILQGIATRICILRINWQTYIYNKFINWLILHVTRRFLKVRKVDNRLR